MEHAKQVGDVVSISTIAATFLGWLPHVATILSVVWMLIRIYETKTVQGWLRARGWIE